MKPSDIKPVSFPVIFLTVFLAVPVFGKDSSEKEERSKETVIKGVVILVDFPDVGHGMEKNIVQARFSRQLNNYVKEMSYGKVSLDIDVTGQWYAMPDPVSRYRISPRNLEVDKSRVRKLIDDALDAADDEVDYSKYFFAAIFMGAEVSDYGMVGLCGYPGMLGWSDRGILKTQSGESLKGGVAIFCFQAHVGTLFHDIAHILGGVKDGRRGVPCLYDHDLQARLGPLREVFEDSLINMGFWDPMSCHYIKMGVPPPGISSWTRMRLNWIDRSNVRIVDPSRKTEVVLGPLEDGSSDILVVKVPVSETTYYLIENRQPIGCDRFLPASGILIMYADDGIAECRNGKAPVRLMDADPSAEHLEGAAFDIGGKDYFRDEVNKIQIRLEEKIESSYRILIGPL